MSTNKEMPLKSAVTRQRVEDDLRKKVRLGQWRAGAMIPGRRALAKEYRADLHTLQRAVEQLVADGILRVDGGRGTFVADPIPESGPASSLKTIAAILDLSIQRFDPSRMVISQAAYRVIRRNDSGYHLLVFDTHGETALRRVQQESHALKALESDGISGALLHMQCGLDTLPLVRHAMEQNIPLVFVDRHPEDLDCDFVGVDNEGGAQEVTEYLLGLGHRRIACLGPADTPSTVSDRIRGYTRAMTNAGLAPDPNLIYRLPPVAFSDTAALGQAVREAAQHLSSLGEPPSAIFAINDFLAQHFVWAVEENGGTVPGTVSVAGFDDLERYSGRPGFLTTVQQPFEKIGERATELLLRRLQDLPGKSVSFQHLLLPTKLVLRSSCARAEETAGLQALTFAPA